MAYVLRGLDLDKFEVLNLVLLRIWEKRDCVIGVLWGYG